MTVSPLCPFESVGPSFSASGTNQEASGVNGPQGEDPSSSPRRLQPGPWSWGLGVRCMHLVVPFSGLLPLMIGLCISSHEEVGSFSPPLESWGGRETWQRGAGPALHSYSRPPSRNHVDESGAAHRARTVTEDRKCTSAQGTSQTSHPPANQQLTTDIRESPATTRRTAQWSPQDCSKPLNSGAVCHSIKAN